MAGHFIRRGFPLGAFSFAPTAKNALRSAPPAYEVGQFGYTHISHDEQKVIFSVFIDGLGTCKHEKLRVLRSPPAGGRRTGEWQATSSDVAFHTELFLLHRLLDACIFSLIV